MKSIFVQISSYRDRECQWTVKDLFEKATYPERVFVGICWQFIPGDDDDCFIEPYKFPNQVRVDSYHARDTQGLGWARLKSQKLWQNEDYLLQIDSHMRFIDGWDEAMLNMQERCGKRSVLTLYPPHYDPPNKLQAWQGPRVQTVKSFCQDGIIRFTTSPVPEEHASKPQLTAALAGGFFFGPGTIIEEIPADPEIYFNGEEPSLAARLWTHGYDLYSPHKPLIYHYYLRKESRRPWDDDPAWVDKFRTTLKRLRATFTPHIKSNLDEPVTLGNLGLGTVRSLEAYERFSGLNFAGRTVASYARHFPFVYTSDSDLERKDVSISPTAHLFFLEEEAVVFSEEGSILSSLNTAATYVWCALKEKLNQEEIIQGLTRICEIDSGSAKRQYQSLLSHFDGLGFLSQPVSDHLIESESTDEPEHRRVSKGIERAWYRKRSYRLFGSCFLICFSTDEADNWGHAPLAHLELNEHSNPDFVIRLINTDVGYALYVDDVWITEVDHINKMIPQLKFSLMRSAIHNYDYSLHLHAGAISNGKFGLILPGQKGSGKTTLVSSLLTRGYSYLSDEVVLLDRGDCAVRPFPISLCVKSPAVELLSSIYPELVNLPVYQREDGEAVRYLLPPAAARSENIKTPIRYIVFPRYRADAKTALYPIKRVDALKRLLDDCQSIPKPLTLDDVRDIIEWLKTVECYELPHSDLEQASGCLEGLLSLDA